MDISFIEKIERRLQEPLPGISAQKRLSPSDPGKYMQMRPDHRIASVMLLLFPKNEEWHLCYIKRTNNNPNDRHAGQISFPGGKLEETDESYEFCALRETYEEVGVPPDKIGILGQLSELYVHVSNFRVFPFVGFIENNLQFSRQESEVKEILEIPLSHFSDEEILKKGEIKVRNVILQDIPYFDLHGDKLWGATAMMTSEFLSIAQDLW